MKRRKGFTLIELLVVISIIALLLAILLPALGAAQKSARDAQCKSRHRQIGIMEHAFAIDNSGHIVPMQMIKASVGAGGFPGPSVEWSWRGILWEYGNEEPLIYDCPEAEPEEHYADGAFDDQGQPTPGETNLPSGIGAVNVHYNAAGYYSPHGRGEFAGYNNGTNPTRLMDQAVEPSATLSFGDGNSSSDRLGTVILFPEDRFWIYGDGATRTGPGYNRAETFGGEGEVGLSRHGDDFSANYLYLDGHVDNRNANDIECSTDACEWDLTKDPHN